MWVTLLRVASNIMASQPNFDFEGHLIVADSLKVRGATLAMLQAWECVAARS
jgi:hypothetical protein